MTEKLLEGGGSSPWGVALRAVMGSEMADEMLLAGQRVLPAKLTATGYRFRHTELAGALRDLLAR